MAVHQVINHFGRGRGGAERLALELHGRLRAAGWDARLIALEESATEGAGTLSLGLRSPYDPRALGRLCAYARAHVKPGDVVHVHLFPASAQVAALRRSGVLRAPCLFTEHSTSNGRRGRRLGAAVDAAVYGAFARIVAISSGVEASLLQGYPWLRGRTQVILNGCALRFAAPPARALQEVPTILSIGRLAPPKNYRAALRAVAGLDRPIRYVILGDGPERDALGAETAALGIADRVVFAGHCADITPHLLEADMLLMPSLWEGFGLAAVEAMNAALPVVASDVPGLREVVGEDGACAVLVDPCDAASVRKGILRLIDAPEAAAAMGRRGFERARQFDIARMTAGYEALYRALREGERLVS